MDSQWNTLVHYRETINETIPLDEQSLVIALISLGLSPIKAETDGDKLRYHFEKTKEFKETYQLLQKALAGALMDSEKTPVLDFFCREVMAMNAWRHNLAAMRPYKKSTRYVQ